MRRECLDHVLVLGERHLLETLVEYVGYFQQPELTKAPASSSRQGARALLRDAARCSRTRCSAGCIMITGERCTTPVTLAAGNASPSFVAVDGVNVHFTNQGGTVNVVPACNGAGSCGLPALLANGQNKPYGITVGGGDVYWTNLGDGSVAKCAISGCGNLPTVLAVNQQGPRSIVTDGTNVYWTNRGTATNNYLDGRVRWCPLGVGPCPANQLFPGTSTYPNSIATDGIDVFFTQRPVIAGGVPSGGFVLDCSVSGCISPSALASAPNEPEGIATDGQSVYWTEIGTQATGYKDGTIKRCPVGAGCSPVTVASAQTRPFAVAVDQHYVYWTNTTAGTVMKSVK